METEIIQIPPIKLRWSDWYDWESLKKDVRKGEGVSVPDEPGVYEVKYKDSDERLTIGKASNLRMRVKQGLVKGKVPHSAGDRIRKREDTSKIMIRWAVTERPAAAEEELHRRHKERFGRLPKYVEHT